MDPLNPGQFFACCGLLELLTFDNVNLAASFTLDPFRPRVAEFVLETNASDLKTMLTRLQEAKPTFPNEQIEAAIRPASILYDESEIVLDWWLNTFYEGTDNLKCWAGQVTTRKLLLELLPLIDETSSGDDIFERPKMTKAKFGIDPRSAWNALDFGFSPNEQGRDSATFPAVEILGAIGLQGFRPNSDRRTSIRYSLWKTPLPASVARLAFRAPWDGLPHSDYQFSIAKRGQSYKYFTFAVNSNEESETNERKSI
jgi:CRISPR-associated protein Csx14